MFPRRPTATFVQTGLYVSKQLAAVRQIANSIDFDFDVVNDERLTMLATVMTATSLK